MVESTRQVQSRDPFERFNEAVNDPRLYETYERADLAPYSRTELAPYESNQLVPAESAHEPVPLFLSDYDDDRYRDGSDYTFGKQKPQLGTFRISSIVAGAVALVAAAGGAALFSMDSTGTAIVNTKASLAGVAPVSISVTPPEATQQPRVAAVSPVTPQAPAVASPPPAPEVQAARRSQPGATASTSPSREEITAAYQSAVKSRVVAFEPAVREAPAAAPLPAAAPPAAPAARRIDADELAALLKRAKSLLAVGDITSARLLLERAADAHEAEAALMLAGTYDPQVLGVQDMRSITPDPAMARAWYQKAADLGSADARRRLSQLQ